MSTQIALMAERLETHMRQFDEERKDTRTYHEVMNIKVDDMARIQNEMMVAQKDMLRRMNDVEPTAKLVEHWQDIGKGVLIVLGLMSTSFAALWLIFWTKIKIAMGWGP